MMTPTFLSHKNTEYFDLNNQDHSHEDQQQQVLESSSFYPPSYAASSISSLQLEQGLGMSATHSMSDQSLAFDQLEDSKNMFFNMISPTYGDQLTSTNNYDSQNHEIFIFKQQDQDQEPNNPNKSGGIATDSNGSSLRWMSSKMRMMRRMINSNDTKTSPRNGSRIIPSSNNHDHGPQLNVTSDTNTDITNGIQVCSDCNTTKTPLWRSGPQGPKTLCNACGIRQRKARKAAMEAAAATNSSCEAASSSTSSKTTIKLKINKEKNKSRATGNTCVSQHINKKQTTCNKQQTNTQLVDSDHTNNSSTSNTSSKRQMFFEQFAVNSLSKNAAFHRMFPQDEEEGALLLMALSYGFADS